MNNIQGQKDAFLNDLVRKTQEDIWMSEMVIFREEEKKEGADKTALKLLDKKIAKSQDNIERMKTDLEMIERYRTQNK